MVANRKFQVPINLVNLPSDPASADEGDIYYNTTSDVVRVYANGSWVTIGSGGGGASTINDLTDVTISDISDNEILQYDSGTSQWINQTATEAGLVLGVGTNKITYSTTEPTSPSTGDIWIDSDAITSSSSDAVLKTTIDAKGDLLVGTAADTVSRLAVGATNGHVLTVDSAESTGLKWAAQSGGGSLSMVPMVSGGYYYTVPASNSSTGATNNLAYYLPLIVAESTTFDRITCRTGSSFSGTAVVRLGIYNQSGGLPDTLILDAGTVSCTSSNTVYEITIDETLSAGVYYLAFCSQTNAATNNFRSSITGYMIGNYGTGTGGGGNILGWSESGVSGAFTTASASSTSFNVPTVWLRTA